LFATTPDSLPYIGPHRRYPRHLFALGYGGNGRLGCSDAALDWYRGKRSGDHELFAFHGEELVDGVVDLGFVIYRVESRIPNPEDPVNR
jgi:hypothetical protein